MGTLREHHFVKKPLPAACADAEKVKEEYLIVGKTRGKLQTVAPQCLEAPTGKDTYNLTPSTSSKANTRSATPNQSGINVSRGVSCLMSNSLNEACTVVFKYQAGTPVGFVYWIFS